MQPPFAVRMRAGIVCTVLLVLLAQTAEGAAAAAAPTAKYLILDDKTIYLQDMTGSFSKGVKNIGINSPQDGSSAISTPAPTSLGGGWWKIVFDTSIFRNGGKYNLSYATVSDGIVQPPVSIDASPSFSITPIAGYRLARMYKLASNVAFQKSGALQWEDHVPDGCPSQGGDDWAEFDLAAKANGKQTIKVLRHEAPIHKPGDSLNYAGIGVLNVCLVAPLGVQSFSLDTATPQNPASGLFKGLASVLTTNVPKNDGSLQLGKSAAFAAPAAPATKSDASFYANFNIAAATGAKGAWGLDGKIAKVAGPFLHGYGNLGLGHSERREQYGLGTDLHRYNSGDPKRPMGSFVLGKRTSNRRVRPLSNLRD